jgi:hypothetical protein
MRFVIVLTFFLSRLIIPSFAQTNLQQEVILTLTTLPIREVINQIQEQTEFTFSFSNELPLDKNITFLVGKIAIADILNKFKSAGIRYKIKDNKIILAPPVSTHTVSGYLRDAASGENLIGGSIYVAGGTKGITSNSYGYYSLTLPEDSVHLIVSYVGYQTAMLRFVLKKDTAININMVSQMLDEVVIKASDAEQAPDLTQMSAISIPIQQLEALPALIGEIDIMKGLQLLPGVQSGGEGTGGLYVRGGGPDQNLVLLDGVPVYNVSHLFGFFSVFNSDAINHVALIKGGFPARYGGRLSSVVDISMKEGDMQKVKGEGSTGIIATRLTLEGPIKKNKASFIFSGRRTYLDIPLKIIFKMIDNDNTGGYFFQDFNAKVNYIVNKKNRLYFSTYAGKDKADTRYKYPYWDSPTYERHEKTKLIWGNFTSVLRWNHILSPKIFVNVTSTYTRYYFQTLVETKSTLTIPDKPVEQTYFKGDYNSSIFDYAVKADVDFIPSLNHYIKSGAYGIIHTFKPGATSYASNEDVTTLQSKSINGLEIGAYVEDDIVLAYKWKVNAGMHFSAFTVENKSFLSLQPRVSVRYLFNPRFAGKLSYAEMSQFIHLLTNSGVGLPTDLWVPSTSKIKPQRSRQVAVGLVYSFNPTYEITLEGYYKRMDGIIEYKEGASYLNTKDDWQTKVECGKGESYGSEIFLQKKLGSWKSWLGYTLSWSNRQFTNINRGKKFPYRYDRRHDVDFVVSKSLTKRVDFSLVWVYSTGNAVTLPIATYKAFVDRSGGWAGGKEIEDYGERNGFRVRSNHRLDISVTFKKQKSWGGERSWVVGLYNVYSRQNPFYVDVEYWGPEGKKLYQYGLFPVLPFVTYNLKF